MEEHDVDELNFPWGKTALHFSYDLQLSDCNN